MQARYTILPLFLAAAVSLSAQEVADTTDMFFGHVALGEAVVTGVAGRTRLKDSPAPVTLVSENDLRHTSASNIVSAIATQPGVAAITTGSGIAKPVIRGLGYNRIVTIVDGVRQEGQQWGDEHGLELDGASVHTVEILKGPASLMYGSDAMAGVVIFRPAPLRPEGTMGGSASAEYQTNSGLFNYSLNFAGNRGGFVWDARWSQKMAHAYKNKMDGYVPSSQFQEQAFRTLLGIDRNWGHSHLTLGYYHLKPGIIEGERDESGELEAPEGWKGTSYGTALPFQHVHHYKAVWDTDLRLSHGTLKAIIGYQHNRRQEYEESANECELDFLLHTLTYDIRYQMMESDGWRLTGGVGGMWQRSRNAGEEYLIPAYSLFDMGIYLTGSKRLGDVMLSGGVRYDQRHLHSHGLEEDGIMRFNDFRRHMDGLTGSLGAVWQIRRNFNLRLNVAHGFRAPNLSELGSNGVHEGTARYEVGNHVLSPERSWQADVGADYMNRYISLQAALFVNRIDNYIYLKRTAALANPAEDGVLTYQYTSGDARLWGFEVGADLHPIHSLHFQNTFSYVNAVQLHQPTDAKHLPMTPAPRWTSELKWEILHTPTNIMQRMALTNLFIAANMECNLRQNHVYAIDGTETPTPSYTLLGLSAGTDILWRGSKVAELFLCVENLTNRAYQPHLSRLKYMDTNILTGHRGIYNPGRNICVKLTVPF